MSKRIWSNICRVLSLTALIAAIFSGAMAQSASAQSVSSVTAGLAQQTLLAPNAQVVEDPGPPIPDCPPGCIAVTMEGDLRVNQSKSINFTVPAGYRLVDNTLWWAQMEGHPPCPGNPKCGDNQVLEAGYIILNGTIVQDLADDGPEVESWQTGTTTVSVKTGVNTLELRHKHTRGTKDDPGSFKYKIRLCVIPETQPSPSPSPSPDPSPSPPPPGGNDGGNDGGGNDDGAGGGRRQGVAGASDETEDARPRNMLPAAGESSPLPWLLVTFACLCIAIGSGIRGWQPRRS